MGQLVLRFRDVAPDSPYHAALVPVRGTGRSASRVHSHEDFHEFAFLTRGTARHQISDQTYTLTQGDLVFVRPSDTHAFVSVADDGFELINVAFPSTQWRSFYELAELPDPAQWDQRSLPLVVPEATTSFRGLFQDILRRYARGPRVVDVIEFWAAVSTRLVQDNSGLDDGAPTWLARACAFMNEEDNLRAGLTRLLQLAAVSHGHLARSMARYYQCSPVSFITHRRLAHAAFLLATTTEQVGVISSRCGFASQSYFDRRFTTQYGCPPRAYREGARRSVMP